MEKRMRCLAGAVALALLAAGCARSDGPVEVGGPERLLAIQPGEPFPVAIGERVKLGSDGPTVGFLAVPADDRCPADVVCVWAGDATVELTFRLDTMRRRLELHTGREPRQASAGDYLVSLDELRPAPLAGVDSRPADYVAVLRVTAR
jgi:hypothetical protein